MLVATGVLAGIIASIVGGAAVVVCPAMIAAGLKPQMASVANLTALMPATMLAALTDRSQLPPFNRAFIGRIFASIFGAAAGAVLLLSTPDRLFSAIVPLLLGFATVLFAFSERIGAWLKKRAAHRGHDITFNVTSLKILLPVSFYGGYFGAGILILGVLTLATGGDYRSANVTKSFVSNLNELAASVIFAAQGAIVWPQTLALMASTIAGGFAGAHLACIIPRHVVQVLIVMIGAALTLAFAYRYWL
jgi:hypothetical protein